MDLQKPFISNFPYFVLVPPAILPVTLAEVKTQLRLDPSDTSQDTFLTLLIESTTLCCEQITRRTLITTTFRTLRNSFSPAIELRRTLFQTLLAFEYKVDDAFVAVDPTLFYTTFEKDYSKIILRVNERYPEERDDILQGIQIEFDAGYGSLATDIPPNLRLAILNHISALYENRGDCDAASIENSLPNTSRMIYNKFRILEMANG